MDEPKREDPRSTQDDPARLDQKETLLQGKRFPLSQNENPTRDLESPPSIAGYELREEIARGGMGVVWKAWDSKLRRTVAIKEMLPDYSVHARTSHERFEREGRAAARLTHPNIVPVYEAGIFEERPYLCSAYIEGRPLGQIDPPPPWRQSVEWVRAIAGALAYAHREGIVHRDVKPPNILIDRNGHPYLTDFGLARDGRAFDDQRLTKSGQILGTPGYLSPEQIGGKGFRGDEGSDQFALGVVLYELVSGKHPFLRETMSGTLVAISSETPPPVDELDRSLPHDLAQVCQRAMARKVENRFGSMDDFESDLGRVLRGEAIAGGPVLPLPARIARSLSTHRWAFATLVLIAAVASGIALTLHPSPTDPGRATVATPDDVPDTTPDDAPDAAIDALLAEGIRLLDEKKHGDAADRFRQVLEADPTRARALVGRAICRNVDGDAAGALEDATRAIELDPKKPESYLVRGRFLHRLGEYDAAIQDFSRASSLGLRTAEVHNHLGYALLQSGDAKGAYEEIVRAIALEPSYPDSFSSLGELFRLTGDPERAIAAYTKALEVAPTDWHGRASIEKRLANLETDPDRDR